MAYGLPVEGDDGPFLGGEVAAATTCDVTLTVADARGVIERSATDVVVLVHAGGLAVGEVDRETLDGQEGGDALLDVFQPVPSTVRPSVTVASVAESGGGDRLVTTSDGRLLGRAAVAAPDADTHDDHGHNHDDHDDHEGHGHDGASMDMERYERELTEVMEAIGEHFGDREPPPEELRAFLHGRLMAEGRSAEEADRFLDEMEIGDMEIGGAEVGEAD